MELPEPVKLTYAGKTPAGKQKAQWEHRPGAGRVNGSLSRTVIRKAEKSGYGTKEHCSKSSGAAKPEKAAGAGEKLRRK